MAEKDITEKTFIALNDVFADIFNVLVFRGRPIVTEGALTDRTVTSQYKANDKRLHEQERDVFKQWNGHGFNLVLAGIENQTEPDKDMPLRVIGYDGAAYRSQILDARNKAKKDEEESGDLEIQDNRSRKDRHPVVTIILYFGEKLWNYPKNLKDCFYPPLPQNEAGEILDDYIQDYKIHVFDIPRLSGETVEKFQSDFRVVAEYFTNVYTNPEYVPEPYVIRHVDEFLKMMKVLTGDARYETMMFSEDEKKEGIDVCRVLDYREARGEARGIARLNQLMSLLFRENRLDEMKQVLENEKVREEYLAMYGI